MGRDARALAARDRKGGSGREQVLEVVLKLGSGRERNHLQTLIIYKLGFNPDRYTLTVILLAKIVLCGRFPRTTFCNDRCFDMSTSVLKKQSCRESCVYIEHACVRDNKIVRNATPPWRQPGGK